jgi:2-aminoadipate transaminase
MPVLAQRIDRLEGSPVRAMLKAAQQPGVISFAGGLPAPDSFADITLPNFTPDMLQYGPTEGEPALRARVAEELCALGFDVPAERVMIISGSQQGIDLMGKLTVDVGAPIAVEEPTYLAALQVFRLFGARFVGLDWDEPPCMAYVIPTFQNPTGDCWNLEKRQALADACEADGVILFEDDPYRDLAYDPCERRPVASLMGKGSWVYQGSFSKILAPGLRLGYLAASEDLFPHLVRLKQAADLHSNRLSQAMALAYLNDPARMQRLSALCTRYRTRRDGFAEAMDRHLGLYADWQVPPGGLFFWATLRDGRRADALLEKARERNVLFTPGQHFTADGEACASAMRLSFSHADAAQAEQGLATLGALLAEG